MKRLPWWLTAAPRARVGAPAVSSDEAGRARAPGVGAAEASATPRASRAHTRPASGAAEAARPEAAARVARGIGADAAAATSAGAAVAALGGVGRERHGVEGDLALAEDGPAGAEPPAAAGRVAALGQAVAHGEVVKGENTRPGRRV